METLTLLFTDIEGSTALYERVGEIYRTALALHDAAMRAGVEQHGGRRVRHTGDGMIAAFDEPAAAARCAVTLRESLARARWPEATGPLRVRMGLHRGEVESDDADYHGLAMHHASRVMGAAHGGQILCSAAVAEHLSREMIRLRDCGFFRLRGMPLPMRLFALGDSSDEEHFPPPNAPPAFTHRLPVPRTRYFGREAEIAELCGLLQPRAPGGPPCLVTLLGPGGNGKTRLSLQVAQRSLSLFSHAVWFVALADLREPALVMDRIAEAFGVMPESGQPVLELCARYLCSQPSLLILDNYEQLLPAGAEIVATLLAAVPSLSCLVNSRIRLDLSGEIEFRLAPLRLPSARSSPEDLARFPAAQIFLDRARLARRDFAITPENSGEVAELCRALEGIPLALELAAARSAVLTPRQMLVRLSTRLDIPSGKKHDLPERHRTLRAAIAWSFDLLDVRAQAMFAWLSTFRGGWTLEAAEAVTGLETALELLAELQACSLVETTEQDGAMRYTMLEVLRDFAAEQLATDPAASVARARHHAFFFALCKNVAALDEPTWHRRLAQETDNLRALLDGTGDLPERLRATVCLYPFWMHRGMLAEGRSWLRRLRAEHGPVVETTGAAAANAAAILAWKAGDHFAARADFELALAFWRTQGVENNVAGLLNNLAILEDDAGDLPAARQYYERSLATYRAANAEAELPAVLGNLGQNALRRGDLAAASLALRESAERARSRGDFTELANATHNLAELALRTGEPDKSRMLLAESFALRSQLGSRDFLADGWLALGQIAMHEELPRRAALCFFAARVAQERQEEQPSPESQTTLSRDLDSIRQQIPPVEIAVLRDRACTATFSELLDAAGVWREFSGVET